MADRMRLTDVRFFDRKDDVAVSFGRLPHWSQAGTLTFITWRTADSMPRAVVDRWVAQRTQVLQKFGLDPSGNWRAAINDLPIEEANLLRWELIENFDLHLDECHGKCPLRVPEIAAIVADSLRKFDQERYVLTDFVVMPNHIHVLAAFPTEDALRSQISNWKRFQAREIQRALKGRGHFWQEEDFDHLVRSEEQYLRFRKYIADNPTRAGLPAGSSCIGPAERDSNMSADFSEIGVWRLAFVRIADVLNSERFAFERAIHAARRGFRRNPPTARSMSRPGSGDVRATHAARPRFRRNRATSR